MSTAIYLSNNIIRIVSGVRSSGRITVKQEIAHEMAEGNLINGVITNAANLEHEIAELWQTHNLPKKDVYLVVHSSKFVSKHLTLPDLKKKKVLPMIPMEFTDVDRYEDALYDYMKMPKKVGKGMQEVLGIMAERSFVEEYLEMFERLGIKLAGFNHAMGALINTLDYMKFLKKQTCIIQIVDEYTLESVLWVDGEFVHSTNRRIFAEPGSVEFHTEILRHTSSTMQFFTSLKLEKEIKEVFVCGVTMEEVTQLATLEQEFELGLDILPLDVGSEVKGNRNVEKIADYTYAFGGLIKGPADINLLEVYKKPVVSAEQRKALDIKNFIPMIGIAGVGIVVTAVLGGMYLYNSSKLGEIKDYLNEPMNINAVQQVDQLDETIARNSSAILEADNMEAMMESYPLVNNAVKSAVEKVAGNGVTTKISGYNAQDGSLSLSAKAAAEIEVSSYINGLYGTNLFSNIEYTGYSYIESDQAYTINLTCYLAETAGR